MRRTMCKSKIQRATVTEANLFYEGSITIDQSLLETADILPYEKVSVLNVNTGARFDTYAIVGEPGKGTVCLNGPAARLAHVGDQIVIISYAEYDEKDARGHTPKLLFVDDWNKIREIKDTEQN